MMGMNKLTHESRCAVIRCLVEGCSIRSTVRITGVAKNTIQKLTREVGEACLEFQDKALRDLPCKRRECDEIWNFCYAKDKNLPDEMRGMPGVSSRGGHRQYKHPLKSGRVTVSGKLSDDLPPGTLNSHFEAGRLKAVRRS